MELLKSIGKIYNYNEPFFVEEIKKSKIVWEKSNDSLKQALKRLTDNGELIRFEKGIYFIPSDKEFKNNVISNKLVYEKKYIKNNNQVFGVYGGIYFENILGLTTQLPNVIEIITNKEKSRARKTLVGNQKIYLKSPKVEIDNKNFLTVQLLEYINEKNFDSFSSEDKTILKKYIKKNNIKRVEVFKYLGRYPAKASKKIIESGLINDFAE